MAKKSEVVSERCRCKRCHRALKDPDSIAVGLGPICAAKVAKEAAEAKENRALEDFEGGEE